jgi:ketosteroid isomerase-like protein
MHTANAPIDLQYLVDRAAIQDVLARYFHGLDSCNKQQVRSCFTEDVHVHYDQRPPVSGIEAVMTHFRTFGRMEKGEVRVTTHFMGNLNLKYVRGDVAETEMNAIAFLAHPEDRVAMRSLRYIDRLRRDENGWRISDRIHTLDWSCRIPTDFATTLAQRVSVLPERS